MSSLPSSARMFAEDVPAPRKYQPKFWLDLPEAIKKLKEDSQEKIRTLHEVVGQAEGLDTATHMWYFKSYEQFEIHRTMVNDIVRTGSYLTAITRNHHVFKDCTVLDVGCGTGVLSVFAINQGTAKKVLAVDASSITQSAEQLVQECKLQDKIQVIQARIEKLSELPGGIKQVDVIISEWMGYGLLNESMLDSVIIARKRFLRDGGFMLPDMVKLRFLASSTERIIAFDYCKESKESSLMEASFGTNSSLNFAAAAESGFTLNMTVHTSDVLTESTTLKAFNMYTVEASEVFVDESFQLTCKVHEKLRCFVLFFDVIFDLPNPWRFSTSPQAKPTHWMQTVCPLDDDDHLEVWRGTVIFGRVRMQRLPAMPRFWTIIVDYTVRWKKKESVKRTKTFYMV